MNGDAADSLQLNQWPDRVRKVRERTPARLLAGRAGAAYRTVTQMHLREAHAAARDAVRTELDLNKQFDPDFIHQWGLFEVSSQATSKEEYLLHPNLGRVFSESARATLREHATAQNDLQIAIGDGLSVTAVFTQIPKLLPPLCLEAKERGWRLGEVFVIRHCRVGILNEIGELLHPTVAILLIGERPGLATAESLSAYMAYRPNHTQTDADRNLISNIHARGICPADAAGRILKLAARMMDVKSSGAQLSAGLAEF